MDWKVCICVVYSLCVVHGYKNVKTLTTNANSLLQYSSTEIVRFDLTFNNVPATEHSIYYVIVTGMWSADLYFEDMSKVTSHYQKMTARSVKLYAMLTSQRRLCDSQLMFDTEHLTPEDSTELTVNFVNNCDGVGRNTSLVLTKGQFSCTTPEKVVLPPYLYYVWTHDYLNASVNIGPYEWRSSEPRSTFSIVAQHFDNNTMLRCKLALNHTRDHEIVLKEYTLITNTTTMLSNQGKDKPPTLILRYGNNHHVKFDCIDARPHDSFGWHLIEVNEKNYVRVSDNIINNRTFTEADSHTQLICLFYVRDERVITKKALLVYDHNYKEPWMGREVTQHTYYLIGIVAFVIIIIIALLVLLWYYKASQKISRVEQNELTHSLLSRKRWTTDTQMLPITNERIKKPAIRPKPPIHLVRPLVQYTNLQTEQPHCSKDIDKYPTEANNVEDETPVYENLRTDLRNPGDYYQWKK